VVTVSVGEHRNESELRAIASRNGSVDNMFHASSYDHLDALVPALHAALCNGQSHTACSTTTTAVVGRGRGGGDSVSHFFRPGDASPTPPLFLDRNSCKS